MEGKEHYIKAGKVVQECREIAKKTSKPGTKLERIAERIETHIREEGLKPAFPVNTSINEEAAHYTPKTNDSRTLENEDVLKVDIGAQSNGYIADSAITINPSGKHQEMIDAVEKVLQNALEFVEPGVTVGELGTHIENSIPEEYYPIRNLTGHYIDQYEQHAGVSIPNIRNTNTHEIKKGDAIAIEPFLTTGQGQVKQGAEGNIYVLEEEPRVRGRAGRQILKEMKKYKGLPFTTRWLDKYQGSAKMAFKRMVKNNQIKSYPILNEADEGMVVQAEHTVLVGANNGENIVSTKKH